MSLQELKEQEMARFNILFGEAPKGTPKWHQKELVLSFIKEHDIRLEQAIREDERSKIDENTSDGYHTFKELYEFRLLYNANLFNEWARQGLYNVHKSQRHFDGELCFGRDDYFVVVAELPNGQISNHYPMSDWDLFKCPGIPKALAQWDGHTSQDVAKRLRDLLTLK